jgi:UDP-3-O-[3-hydroxymyristoyl] glucosamine N-acyltransferase
LIEDDVKTDDHVHIAHNCIVRCGVQIAAHSELSGSVIVEENAWISPNVSITNGITIGARSQIGIGACITKVIDMDSKVLNVTKNLVL